MSWHRGSVIRQGKAAVNRNLLDKHHLVQLPSLEVLESTPWLMARREQLRNPRLLMLRKMTRHAFTVESCTVSLAKNYDIGFVVKRGVRNGHMHYVQELQLKINILFVKYVYQTKAMCGCGYCMIVL